VNTIDIYVPLLAGHLTRIYLSCSPCSIIVLRDAKIHLDLDEAVSEPEEIEEEEAE
jgi:hypothetical protein